MSRYFPGTTTKLQTASSSPAALDFSAVGARMTAFGWMKVTQREASFSQNNLVNRWDATGHQTFLLNATIPNSGAIGVVGWNIIDSSGSGRGGSCPGARFGEWFSAAGVQDGTNVWTWCNGAFTKAASGPGIGQSAVSQNVRPTVGLQSGGLAPLIGYAAHIAIWDIDLSVAELRALCAGIVRPHQVRPARLKAYWPLDHGGNDLRDASGNGNPLSVQVGPVPQSTDTPYPVERPRTFRRTLNPPSAGTIFAPFIPASTTVYAPTLVLPAVAPFDSASVSVSV